MPIDLLSFAVGGFVGVGVGALAGVTLALHAVAAKASVETHSAVKEQLDDAFRQNHER